MISNLHQLKTGYLIMIMQCVPYVCQFYTCARMVMTLFSYMTIGAYSNNSMYKSRPIIPNIE